MENRAPYRYYLFENLEYNAPEVSKDKAFSSEIRSTSQASQPSLTQSNIVIERLTVIGLCCAIVVLLLICFLLVFCLKKYFCLQKRLEEQQKLQSIEV